MDYKRILHQLNKQILHNKNNKIVVNKKLIKTKKRSSNLKNKTKFKK